MLVAHTKLPQALMHLHTSATCCCSCYSLFSVIPLLLLLLLSAAAAAAAAFPGSIGLWFTKASATWREGLSEENWVATRSLS
jgi:hypothetical protein